MKKPVLIGLVSLFFVFFCYQIVLSFSSQPPVGRTGAPSEGNCTACHSGVLNSGSGGLTHTFGNNDTTYFPNQTYSITVTLNDPFLTRFGFQLTALTASNTTTPGMFTAVNTANTTTQTGNIGGNLRRYVGHFNANTNNTWTFNWTAPTSDLGPITFYLIGNATNNNGNTNGDQAYMTSFIILPPPALPPVADFNASATTTCPGSSITFTDQSTLNPTSRAWSFPGGTPATSSATNPVITYSTPGSYPVTLIATNPNGSDTLVRASYITVNDTPSAALDMIVQPNCTGESSGEVRINPVGGQPTYTFLWSNGDTTPNLLNVPAGSYNVVITDANQCSGSVGPFVVTNPSPFFVSIDSIVPSSCGDTNGAVFASTTGGTGNIAYSWNTGSTNSFIDSLAGGGYTVEVTDANNCRDTATATVLVLGAPVLGIQVIDNECHGDSLGEIEITPSGGTPPYTYTWNTGDTTSTISNLIGGTYSITVSDSLGCAAWDTFVIVEPTPLVTLMGSTPESSPGAMDGEAWAEVTGGSPAYLYLWDTQPQQFTDTATGLAGGTYFVEIEDENGCLVEDSVTVGTLAGLFDPTQGLSLSVYPNPATDRLVIATEGGSTILGAELFDTQGSRVVALSNESEQAEVAVPVAALSPGVYSLRIEVAGQVVWRQVIVR